MNVNGIQLEVRHIPHDCLDKLLINSVIWRKDDIGAFGSVGDGPLRDLCAIVPEIDKLIPQRSIAVQAGGNCGLYAKQYSMMFSEVYSFEPDFNNFMLLALNAPENCFIFKAALDKQITKVLLDRQGTEQNCGAIKAVGWQRNNDANLYAMTVDQLKLPKCSLIHFDLEGFERFAIKGADKTIVMYKPVVILEDIGNHAIKYMQARHNYRIYKRVFADTILLPPTHENYNDCQA